MALRRERLLAVQVTAMSELKLPRPQVRAWRCMIRAARHSLKPDSKRRGGTAKLREPRPLHFEFDSVWPRPTCKLTMASTDSPQPILTGWHALTLEQTALR